jgi:cyclic pyranopterin phosphate synthase
MPGLTQRDVSRLAGVHPDLVRVVQRARGLAEFMVIEGVRLIAKSGGKSGDWQADSA